MVPVMAGPFQMIGLTVIVIGPGPMLDELLIEELEVIVPDFSPIANRSGETRQILNKVVAPVLLKLADENFAPRQTSRRANVRLVCEYAGNSLPELLANFPAIRLEG